MAECPNVRLAGAYDQRGRWSEFDPFSDEFFDDP